MEKKKDIRTRILNKRNSLSEEEVLLKSKLIERMVMSTEEFVTSKNLYLYMDFRNEVKTNLLLHEAFELGKQVYLPKIENQHMEFYKITNINQVEKGNFGILEPVSRERSKETTGLVIVPGSVFDKNGNRIGYGKGYYDQYFTNRPGFIKFAIAYRFQVLAQIPSQEHDVRIDRIFTEEGLIIPEE